MFDSEFFSKSSSIDVNTSDQGYLMHPDLELIADELKKLSTQAQLRFALSCVDEVACNLEDETAIKALAKFREIVAGEPILLHEKLLNLAQELNKIASEHQGSKSIDGTRHAAVSATYALAKAVNNRPIDAAAYAAYSLVYGYGGYAVNDPDAFTEVHQRQMSYLKELSSP
jgi:hypothetical protein